MIPLKFYRDDEYVYINNPNGVTKKMTIAEFEDAFEADTSELPSYTSSDAGKVLAVNSGGTGLEWAESSGGSLEFVGTLTYNPSQSSTVEDGQGAEIDLDSASYVDATGTPSATPIAHKLKCFNGYMAYVNVMVVGIYGADSENPPIMAVFNISDTDKSITVDDLFVTYALYN